MQGHGKRWAGSQFWDEGSSTSPLCFEHKQAWCLPVASGNELSSPVKKEGLDKHAHLQPELPWRPAYPGTRRGLFSELGLFLHRGLGPFPLHLSSTNPCLAPHPRVTSRLAFTDSAIQHQDSALQQFPKTHANVKDSNVPGICIFLIVHNKNNKRCKHKCCFPTQQWRGVTSTVDETARGGQD